MQKYASYRETRNLALQFRSVELSLVRFSSYDYEHAFMGRSHIAELRVAR